MLEKHACAQDGTRLFARLRQSVAVAVTVTVVREGRTVVVVAFTPKQLQAEEYSSLLTQEEAYVGIALGVTVT
jgi:hypothetical protein